MSRVLSVAWRDFKHTVLTKAFMFAVIGFPVLLAVIGVVAVIILSSHEEPALEGKIAVVDQRGEVAPMVERAFASEDTDDEANDTDTANANANDDIENAAEALGAAMSDPTSMQGNFGSVVVRIEVESHGADADADALEQRVRNGDLLAVATIPESIVDPPVEGEDRPDRFDLSVNEDVSAEHTSLIVREIGRAVVRARILGADLDPDEVNTMLDRPGATTTRMSETSERVESDVARELKMMVPMAFMMLIWIATFTAGQQLLMSTIEEKSNKVMEILLSAVSPLQLMAGKILGQGAAGLIMVVMYGGVSIVGLIVASTTHLVEPLQLLYFAAFFPMAYLMVAAVMAAVGSAVSDVREANSLLTPVMLIMFFPLMLWMPISQAPNGVFALVLSFIPPVTPFVMILRVTSDESVPFWQIPVTIVWGYLCVFGMIWLSARIFRVGVLMQGKPPSPLQLLKWVRYS